MPAPLSNDLRTRILKARQRGETIEQIAREKEVSVSAIVRLLRLHRETGSHEARPLNNGRKPMLSQETLQLIKERIERQPDITLKELKQELSLPVSEAALCKTINNKLGLVRKKTGYAAEQDREDVCLQRIQWREQQLELDPSHLVFLDESGVNTGMTRIYGRAASHKRVREAMPDTRFERTSVLSSVRLDGTMVPMVFEGALNSELFKAYVEKMLAPSINPAIL